jgi:hypothetical protein
VRTSFAALQVLAFRLSLIRYIAGLRYALRSMKASGGGGAPRGDDPGQPGLDVCCQI